MIPATSPSATPGYLPHLDGLRALAVLAVVGFHAGFPGMDGGFLGVDVFFVLSGFLIFRLLCGTGMGMGSFLFRRAIRLYPALLVAAVGTWVLSRSLSSGLLFSQDQWPALLYWTDYHMAMGEGAHTWRHAWSLAVEAKFYVLAPLVVPRILKLRRRGWVLLGLWAVATAWRMVVESQWGWNQGYYRFDTRLSGLVLGMAVACIPAGALERAPKWGAWVGLGLLMAGLAQAHWRDPWSLGLGVMAAEVGTAWILAWPPGALHRALSWKPAVYVGWLSYGIYLWHYPLLRFPSIPGVDGWAQTAGALALTAFASWASWRLVEGPARRAGMAWLARRRRAPEHKA